MFGTKSVCTYHYCSSFVIHTPPCPFCHHCLALVNKIGTLSSLLGAQLEIYSGVHCFTWASLINDSYLISLPPQLAQEGRQRLQDDRGEDARPAAVQGCQAHHRPGLPLRVQPHPASEVRSGSSSAQGVPIKGPPLGPLGPPASVAKLSASIK